VTLKERLRQLASALPSDHSAVTITRADLITLLEDDTGETGVGSARDLTVEEVAHETHRAPSTVRGWLISGELPGFKFNGGWRVPRAALREYLEAEASDTPRDEGQVDITAWRKVGGA